MTVDRKDHVVNELQSEKGNSETAAAMRNEIKSFENKSKLGFV
jgi:hypothetical protein